MFAEELQKGRLTSHSIRTQRPSSPIISSLAALFARWQSHPRTPIRSFVSLLGTCLLEFGCSRPQCCQGSILAPPSASCFRRKHPPELLPRKYFLPGAGALSMVQSSRPVTESEKFHRRPVRCSLLSCTSPYKHSPNLKEADCIVNLEKQLLPPRREDSYSMEGK
jgi:hypothetical protein